MTNIVTKTGFKKLNDQMDLLRERRAKLIIDLEEARLDGDLAENSAYHQIRETVAIVDQQIDELIEKLSNVDIADDNGGGNVVNIGSKIVVDVSGEKKELEIVGNGESDPLAGRISCESPIGSNLMGKKMGDTIEIETPIGMVRYIIVDIK